MIRIEFENLVLQQINADDLEMIRQWRNAPHVVKHMEYRDFITETDQMSWFSSLGATTDLYFKMMIDETPVGVVNLKNINWNTKEAEAGIFLGREDFIGSITPMLAVFVLMKTAFEVMGILQLHAKISVENENALQFNQALGYERRGGTSHGFDHFVCTREKFLSPQGSVRKIQELFTKNGFIKIGLGAEDDFFRSRFNLNADGFAALKM